MFDIVQYRDAQGIPHESYGLFTSREYARDGLNGQIFSMSFEEIRELSKQLNEYIREKQVTPKEEGE